MGVIRRGFGAGLGGDQRGRADIQHHLQLVQLPRALDPARTPQPGPSLRDGLADHPEPKLPRQYPLLPSVPP